MDQAATQRLDLAGRAIRTALHKLYPKKHLERMIGEVAENRMPCCDFRTFVWHTMAKTAAEKVTKRKWELIEADLRHQATLLAVIYAMHCIYERAAKGLPAPSLADERCEMWTWGSKAG